MHLLRHQSLCRWACPSFALLGHWAWPLLLHRWTTFVGESVAAIQSCHLKRATNGDAYGAAVCFVVVLTRPSNLWLKPMCLYNRPAQQREQEIIELFAKAYRCVHDISWPLTVRVSGWRSKQSFTIERHVFSALNILINACMAEKVRHAAVDVAI